MANQVTQTTGQIPPIPQTPTQIQPIGPAPAPNQISPGLSGWKKLVIFVAAAVIVVVAVVGFVIISQGSEKPAGSSPSTNRVNQSPSPAAESKYTSSKYGYSITLPGNWNGIDVLKYRNNTFGPNNKNLTDVQKNNLNEYYSNVEVIYQDNGSKLSFKPRVSVRLIEKGSLSLAVEVANHKQFLDGTYKNLVYLNELSTDFQNQEAFVIERGGELGLNLIHAKELIFERNNLLITIAVITLESDWKNNYDELFGTITNSFSI